MTTHSQPLTETTRTPTASLASSEKPGGLREVAVLAYPVILTQISITAMGFVDSAMVGALGKTELAAVGFGGIWLWTMTCGLIGTTTAVQTFVAQNFGAGRSEVCGAWSWHGTYSIVPITALVSLGLFFGSDWLVAALAPSKELQPLAADYMSMRGLGAVGLALAVAMSSFFRGIGDTKTPLYATLVANLVNVVLDYGLVFGELGLPAWGVRGAGVATACAEWVYFAALLVPFRSRTISQRYRTAPVRPSWRASRRLLVTGLPVGGQWMLEMLSFAAFLTLVAHMGDAAMAASQAFIVLLSLSFMQAIGVSIAVSTLVGNYIGSEQPDAAARSFRSGLVIAGVLGIATALVFVAAPTLLMSIFSSDPEVLALGASLLWVGAVFQIFDAFAIIADGALRGAGDTRWPFVVRCALAWGLFLPLGYTLGIALDGGLTWAWGGGVVYVAALAGVLVWRFRSGAWRNIKI
jgi:MATE family multidrug resistance protein